mmetsp:Transcript_101756/g.294477  ORF Transcript_101756/g.294477 Transcript_101756/m.294477 type:complete len:464 (+) Transcript_101756:626-2017(+)
MCGALNTCCNLIENRRLVLLPAARAAALGSDCVQPRLGQDVELRVRAPSGAGGGVRLTCQVDGPTQGRAHRRAEVRAQRLLQVARVPQPSSALRRCGGLHPWRALGYRILPPQWGLLRPARARRCRLQELTKLTTRIRILAARQTLRHLGPSPELLLPALSALFARPHLVCIERRQRPHINLPRPRGPPCAQSLDKLGSGEMRRLHSTLQLRPLGNGGGTREAFNCGHGGAGLLLALLQAAHPAGAGRRGLLPPRRGRHRLCIARLALEALHRRRRALLGRGCALRRCGFVPLRARLAEPRRVHHLHEKSVDAPQDGPPPFHRPLPLLSHGRTRRRAGRRRRLNSMLHLRRHGNGGVRVRVAEVRVQRFRPLGLLQPRHALAADLFGRCLVARRAQPRAERPGERGGPRQRRAPRPGVVEVGAQGHVPPGRLQPRHALGQLGRHRPPSGGAIVVWRPVPTLGR